MLHNKSQLPISDIIQSSDESEEESKSHTASRKLSLYIGTEHLSYKNTDEVEHRTIGKANNAERPVSQPIEVVANLVKDNLTKKQEKIRKIEVPVLHKTKSK